MFGGKKGIEPVGQVETIIGQNTTIKGSLSSSGSLRIDGQFEGDVNTSGELIVGEAGRVKAQITARSAMIAGTITGNMDVSEKLELLPSAKVVGDLKVGSLIIGEGAIFKGNCEMKQSVE
jgi:cytoskeletal protein CcmA (bactofilin family)